MLRWVGRRAASIPGLGRVLLVASCKGGVGKSTVAVNTACALADLGHAVGLLDADVSGPSVPHLTSTSNMRLMAAQDSNILPIPAYNIETVSLGHAVPSDVAAMWRGPMLSAAVRDLLTRTLWTNLDYLVVDTPPGTGDILLTLRQLVTIDGALLVTTPQSLAISDLQKSVDFFSKTGVPMLGLVKNFDGFVCPHCGAVGELFSDALDAFVRRYSLEVLGRLPVDKAMSASGEAGCPIVLQQPTSVLAATFRTIANRIAALIPPRKADAGAARQEGDEKAAS